MIFLPSVVSVARVAVVAAVALLILLTVQDCRIADRDARIAVQTAERAGWTASTGRPRIPDAPPGTRPVATVSGSVRYMPVRPPVAAPPAPGAPPPPTVPAGAGCDLDSLAVDMDCRAEVATASGVPVARLWVHGVLEHDGQRRELPWARVGNQITIPVPGGLQPVETAAPEVRAVALPPPDRFALGLRRPSQWRTGWVAGVGVSADVYGRTAPAAFVGYGISF